MVYKKKTYKKNKKAYKKKALTKSVIPRNMVNVGKGFPKKMTMTHKYNEFIYLQSVSGALNWNTWSANGMYDPNNTGVGHQPMYFDQMGALYNHYTVIGSKMTVTIINMVASQIGSAFGILVNDDTTVTPTSYQMLGEQTQGKTKFIGTSITEGQKKTVAKWSGKKIFGGNMMNNTLTRGTTSSNPTEQSHYTVYFQAVDLVNTTACYVYVEIEYIAVWSELKDLAGS